MKILVFMSDNRELCPEFEKAQYNSLAAAINATYCQKHGYDFIYYRPFYKRQYPIVLTNCLDPNTKMLRHAAWSKLLSAQKACRKPYDYVVYIDSDCIFKDFEKSLETFLAPYTEKDWIFLCNRPFSGGATTPCSGFFICKPSPTTLQTLNQWFAFRFSKTQPNPYKWEQGALFYLHPSMNCVIVDELMFVEEAGQFLRHIPTAYASTRQPYFRARISELGISFTETIKKIQLDEFDTSRPI
jgi:hypothetical protein